MGFEAYKRTLARRLAYSVMVYIGNSVKNQLYTTLYIKTYITDILEYIGELLSMLSTPTTSTSASTPSNEVQLAAKPSTTSPVWKYFAVEIDGNGKS